MTVVRLLGGFQMFDGEDRMGVYDELQHLFEMTFLLCSIPPRLLTRARFESRKQGLLHGVSNGGRVFDPPKPEALPRDIFLQSPAGPFGNDQADMLDFTSFLKKMLQLDPENRRSAAQLLREPWLEGVHL